jgi:glucose-1-phosphate cytidylyltransferase
MKKNMKNSLSVMILCGGKGERLKPLTNNLPKPLIKIKKKEILSHIIDHIKFFGLRDIFITSGYKHQMIKKFFSRKHKNCNIKIIQSGVNSDIIKRIQSVIKHSKENLLICYGDTLADININQLYKFHINSKYPVTLSSYEMVSNFGILEMDNKNKVKKYNEKPSLNMWFNIGYIILNKSIFKNVFKFKKFEFFLNNLVQNSKVKSFKHKGLHITVNTVNELEAAKNLVVKFEDRIKY